MVLGTLLGAVGFGLYSITYGVIGFLFADIFLGIGQSLLSGADTALLYDSLVADKKEKNYLKVEGKITAIGNFSEAAAGIFVSVIVFGLYRYYYALQAILAGLAFVFALFLKEPPVDKFDGKAGFKDILRIVNVSLRKNKPLRNVVCFSAAIGLASLTMAWLVQPILLKLNVPETYFGVVWVVLNIWVAIGSLSSGFIDKTLGKKGALFFMAIPLSTGFVFVGLGLNHMVWASILLVLLFYVRGTAHPILKRYINALAIPSERATVLSIRSLLIRMLFFALGPILGYITEKLSLKAALYASSFAVLLPSVLFLMLLLFRENTKKK